MRTSGQACEGSYNDLQDIITETVGTHANVYGNKHHIVVSFLLGKSPASVY